MVVPTVIVAFARSILGVGPRPLLQCRETKRRSQHRISAIRMKPPTNSAT